MAQHTKPVVELELLDDSYAVSSIRYGVIVRWGLRRYTTGNHFYRIGKTQRSREAAVALRQEQQNHGQDNDIVEQV